jgi:hypothetical protein
MIDWLRRRFRSPKRNNNPRLTREALIVSIEDTPTTNSKFRTQWACKHENLTSEGLCETCGEIVE